MNEKNYYQEIIQEIKKIREVDLDQAVLLLKKELSMPYIPSEHEREMKKLFKEYSISFDKKKMTMNREELLEILGEGIENGRQSLALTQISQFN
jgi:DNA-binding NarL/FixJ family response regulator